MTKMAMLLSRQCEFAEKIRSQCWDLGDGVRHVISGKGYYEDKR